MYKTGYRLQGPTARSAPFFYQGAHGGNRRIAGREHGRPVPPSDARHPRADVPPARARGALRARHRGRSGAVSARRRVLLPGQGLRERFPARHIGRIPRPRGTGTWAACWASTSRTGLLELHGGAHLRGSEELPRVLPRPARRPHAHREAAVRRGAHPQRRRARQLPARRRVRQDRSRGQGRDPALPVPVAARAA